MMGKCRGGWVLVFCLLMAGCNGLKGVESDDVGRPFPKTKPNAHFAFADQWGWPHAGSYGDLPVLMGFEVVQVKNGLKGGKQ